MADWASRASLALSGLLLSFAPACAHVPASVGATPTRSPDGVQLALAHESCSESNDLDAYGESLAELTVDVRVSNPTDKDLVVRRDRMHLQTADGNRLPAFMWNADEPVTVTARSTADFDLQFMNSGSLTCNARADLDTSGSVSANGRVLQTDGISFTLFSRNL